MFVKNLVLPVTYPIFKFKNNILYELGYKLEQKLRILLLHDISPKLFSNFNDQILHLMKSWEFITTDQFVRILSGSKEIKKKAFF